MTHLYKLLIPDSSKNLTFILKNSANNSIFASILESRSSNSTSILQFSDSASTRLRLQSFDICLDNEPRVGTPLRRYLDSLDLVYLHRGTHLNNTDFTQTNTKISLLGHWKSTQLVQGQLTTGSPAVQSLPSLCHIFCEHSN